MDFRHDIPNRLRSPLVVAVVAGCVVAVGLAMAQDGEPHRGPGGGSHGFLDGGHAYFDPDTVVTLSGTLTESGYDWQLWGHGNHTGGGMGTTFRADGGQEFDLMLAPHWFLEDNGVVLSQGERITVTASRVEGYDGGYHHGGGPGGGGMHGGHDADRDFLIATSVEADGRRVELRDRDGYPLWRGGVGWTDHWFDPESVMTLTGTLSETLGMWSVMGYGNHTGNGLHYVFEAGGEPYYAMLGPWWYMERQGLQLQEGQRATITGSVTVPTHQAYSGRPFLIATEITVGGVTVRLRDEWGYPVWPGTGFHYYSPAWSEGQAGEVGGQVTKIRRRRNGRRLDKGYEIAVRSGRQVYRIFVAPDWAVGSMGMTLRRGDEVRVRGSILGGGRNREMVAQLIDVGGERWRFRDRNGEPRWVAGNR